MILLHYLGVVMGHWPYWVLHSPTRLLNYLAQNCIRLEISPFSARPLDLLVQNLEPLHLLAKRGTMWALEFIILRASFPGLTGKTDQCSSPTYHSGTIS